MNILITGAGGFLGGWLASSLARRGDAVIAWCRDDRPVTLDFLPAPGVTRVRGDIRDGAAWDRILVRYQPEAIVHLAAESQVRRALELPREAWTSNLLGTVECLESVRRKLAPVKAVVVASSDKAYGPAAYLPYDEKHPLNARAPYDASKAAADICARSYASTYDLPVVVTRSANIYGGGDLNKDRIIPETCRAILEKRDVVLRSDGSPERDYLYVEDACAGYAVILEALRGGRIAPGEVFNFGTNRGSSVRTVVETLLRAAGSHAASISLKLGPAHPRSEIDHQILDASKLTAALGWTPKHSLEDGLRLTWEWHLENWDKLMDIYSRL